MAQYIYMLGAVAALSLFSLMIGGGRNLSQRQMYVNEVSTQLIGVAEEVLNLIDSPKINFDSKTAGLRAFQASVDSLTPTASFGGCNVVTSCGDVDDFDGLSIEETKQGFTYRAIVGVEYVSRTDPDSVVTSPTMSKRVTVTVSTKSVFVGSDSVSAVISRIVPYR